MPGKDTATAFEEFIVDAHEQRLQKVEEAVSGLQGEVKALGTSFGHLSETVKDGFTQVNSTCDKINAKLDADDKAKVSKLEAKASERTKNLRNTIAGILIAVLPLIIEHFLRHGGP